MNLKPYYLTFGHGHRHKIGDVLFDADCVGRIMADSYGDARAIAFDVFGRTWCLLYTEEEFDHEDLRRYYPRGLINVEPNA